MDKKLWQQTYAKLPSWVCPRCFEGRLKLREKSLNFVEPDWVTTKLDENDLRGERSLGRFSGFLQCDADECHEIVAVAGDYVSDYESFFNSFTNSHDMKTTNEFTVRGAIPMPPIIDMPAAVADVVKNHIRAAETLFFVDSGACANKLRVASEALLDQLNVPLKGPNAKGKIVDYSLAQRIDELDKTLPGHKDILDALRLVGNVGSHEGDADFDFVTECFMLMEHVLAELIGKRHGTMDAVAKSIVARRGKA